MKAGADANTLYTNTNMDTDTITIRLQLQIDFITNINLNINDYNLKGILSQAGLSSSIFRIELE